MTRQEERAARTRVNDKLHPAVVQTRRYEVQEIPAQSHSGRAVAINALPLVGVAALMGASAWLPPDNPSLGLAFLGLEILLGAFAITRLVLLVRN